ncbi:hypothetical protein GCM10027317_06180 [Massilia agri]
MFVVMQIHERLKTIISAETEEAGRFGWLQRKTGISRNTWQTWWDKDDAPPGGKMIEAAARLWPQYAFWLATGITDREYGHAAPKDLPTSVTWPEDSAARRPSAAEYLSHCIAMQDKLVEQGEAYRASKEWDRDWEKLNASSWDREISVHSMRILFGAYEDRIREQPAKVNPWVPDHDDGIHPDSE